MQSLKNTIDDLNQEYQAALDPLAKALFIAWNTNRIDLIDRLSKLKDRLHTEWIKQVGARNGKSTGLFLTLEQRLHAVFGNPLDPQDLEAVHDEDPAIEAFPKFSIWFLEDYQEVGLIPASSAEDLQFHDELSLEEHLLSKGEHTLKLHGIHIIRDLKDKQIFSKQMLKEFLNRSH